MKKIKYYAYFVGASVLAFVGLALGKSAYAYDTTDFGNQIDQITSTTQSFVDVLIAHWWIPAIALIVISGVITFVIGLIRGWFHFGGRHRR